MEPKVLKSEKEHGKAIDEVDRLIALDPEKVTPEADRLDLLMLLIETYEKERFRFDLPDPVEAIRFRMEEQGLKQRDLVPYIGNKSKVSEVLSRKRNLTMNMVRALHEGLDIPLEVLTKSPEQENVDTSDIEWKRFPVREMVKRGWINATAQEIREKHEEIAQKFFTQTGALTIGAALCRRTIQGRYGGNLDKYALHAWMARVLIRAKNEGATKEYKKGVVDEKFMKAVARLSFFEKGPLLAQEFLAKHGIALIIEPHLPKTKLDGASMLNDESRPVIGLTLRHDRLDNFWFTLMHELAHVAKHLKSQDEWFIDEIEANYDGDERELEADTLANDIFVSPSEWRRSDAYRQKTPSAIERLAIKCNVHSAVIAGRIRHATNNYKILSNMVGNKKVRILFL